MREAALLAKLAKPRLGRAPKYMTTKLVCPNLDMKSVFLDEACVLVQVNAFKESVWMVVVED